MKTILAWLLFGLSAFAQNVALLTHGDANTDEFKRGCPSNWPAQFRDIGSQTSVPTNLVGAWKVVASAELHALMQSLSAEKEAWNKAQAAREPYQLKKNEFFRRLTQVEWKTIREAAKINDDIAYLWDTLMSLDEGITGPPLADGTDEQKKTKAARDALAQLFTPERADELLKRP